MNVLWNEVDCKIKHDLLIISPTIKIFIFSHNFDTS
jgi:hypothetical protein